MQHLTAEALARLVDEPPGPDEAAHVRNCLACRRELEELRALAVELADMPELDPPAGSWAGLEARLREEGLIHGAAAPLPARWRLSRPWLRAAAALALFVVGGGAGAALWDRWHARGGGALAAAGEIPPARVTRPTGVQPALSVPDAPAGREEQALADAAAGVVLAGGDGLRSSATIVYEQQPDAARMQTLAGEASRALLAGGGSQTVTTTQAAASEAAARQARTARPERARDAAAVRRAERELEEAEAAYLSALERYAALADPASGADPVTRLAALERLVAITREALERTPGDPVINGYHLAALSERDAVRRELVQATQSTWQ